MAQEDRSTLKQYFETGKKPTEGEYANLIDSSVNNEDDKATLAESQAGTDDVKYVTPKGVKSSINTLVPNATISTRGKVELATLAEVASGTDSQRAVTPEGAKRAAEEHAPVQSINGQTGDVVISAPGQTTDRGSTREGIVKYFTNGAPHTGDIFHIKLPYRIDVDNKMYHIAASGYAYNSAAIIDVIWVGYCYKSGSVGNKHKQIATDVSRSTLITAGQYVGSDNHIYLWFKVPNTYYTTFKLDSLKVGNGSLLESGDLQVFKDSSLAL